MTDQELIADDVATLHTDTTPPEDDEGNTSGRGDPAPKPNKRSLPIWLLLLVTPFIVGILWHSLHPVISVFTGEMIPRRWYIDENSLDPAHFRMNDRYALIKKKTTTTTRPLGSLCEAIQVAKYDYYVSCYQHNKTNLQIARVLPSTGPVVPVTEAIVLIVPTTPDWAASQYHYSVRQLIRRLTTSRWLAKTVFVVSPTTSRVSLSETVDQFLELYLGSQQQGTPPSRAQELQLPLSYTGAMLRSLLVLDFNMTTTGPPYNELRILPQGRRGLLPNMDLVFLCWYVYSQAMFTGRTMTPASIQVHPFRSLTDEWKVNWIQQWVPSRLRSWAVKLLDLLSFEYTLAMGPYPPHAAALDRGIDALTIQGHFTGRTAHAAAADQAELVQKMEHVIRALSNLHERLHHSTALYLLPTPDRFIKHEEYLVPNLLLLIPLIVRAITLVLVDIDYFQFSMVGWALSWAVGGTVLLAYGMEAIQWAESSWSTWTSGQRMMAMHVLVGFFYLVTLTFPPQQPPTIKPSAVASIQFISCLVGLVIHVSIAFGHVSLAFPSAMLWVPLLAFPCYIPRRRELTKSSRIANGLISLVAVGVLVVTWPGTWLVPHVFQDYTAYVRYAYVPLHWLVTLLILSRLRS